jgi:hypothetical protein
MRARKIYARIPTVEQIKEVYSVLSPEQKRILSEEVRQILDEQNETPAPVA